jgi:hypothetical protein
MPFAMADARSMSKTRLVIQARNSPQADDSDARSSPAVVSPPLPHNIRRRRRRRRLVHWGSTVAQLLQNIEMAPVGRRGFAGKDILMPEETCAGADGEQPPLLPPDTVKSGKRRDDFQRIVVLVHLERDGFRSGDDRLVLLIDGSYYAGRRFVREGD